MDEQELLHPISVDADGNISLLKDLSRNEVFTGLVKAGKTTDAVVKIRGAFPVVGLREAKMIVEAFRAAWN
jgi:hypothetical protein